MAKKVTVSLIDDFDGKQADETVQFGLDGVSYEIDLSEKNAKKMREGLRPWVDAGRRIGGSRRRRAVGTGGVSVDRKQSADIREWARKSGYEVAAAAGSQPRCSTLIGPPSSAKIAAAATAGIADSVDTLPYLLGEIRILRCAPCAPRVRFDLPFSPY